MLEKMFIKNYKNITNTKVRNKYGVVAGVFGLVTNLFLGIVKIIIGFISNSISITSDAVNNITDSFSSILTIFSFTLASKKPNKNHPYGYARYEYICGFVISLFMLFMGILFAKESIIKIFNNEDLSINIVTYVVLIIGVIIKFLQMRLYLRFSLKINSDALKTNSIDARNDIISSFGILVSIIFMSVFNINIDGFIGLFVSFIAIYSSIKMLNESIGSIIGNIPSCEKVNFIKEKLLSYDFVEGIHDLVIHSYGEGNDFVTVHVEIDSNMDMLTAHDLIDNIENDFKDIGYDLTIHMDPIIIGDKIVDELRELVANVINKFDSTLDIHDFRVVNGPTHTNLLFDCVIPYEKDYTKSELISYLKNNIDDKEHKYYYVIEIDRPFC